MLIAEVNEIDLQAFALIAAREAALEMQDADDQLNAVSSFSETSFQAFEVVVAFLGTFAPSRIAALMREIIFIVK